MQSHYPISTTHVLTGYNLNGCQVLANITGFYIRERDIDRNFWKLSLGKAFGLINSHPRVSQEHCNLSILPLNLKQYVIEYGRIYDNIVQPVSGQFMSKFVGLMKGQACVYVYDFK